MLYMENKQWAVVKCTTEKFEPPFSFTIPLEQCIDQNGWKTTSKNGIVLYAEIMQMGG